jgi:membrane protein implicated in regulation of membrane protease activity
MPDLIPYMWILWIVLALVFVVIELLTLEFTFLMLAGGSVAGLGVQLAGGDWWLQIAVGLVVAVLLLLTIRPLLLAKLHRGADPTPSNLDALSGMSGRVVLAVDETGGQVRLANGETWSARLADPDAVLAVDARVTVTRVHGSVVEVAAAAGPAASAARTDDPEEGTP